MKDQSHDPRILVDPQSLVGLLDRRPRLDIRTRVKGERLSGAHSSRRQGEGYSFEELRVYQAGDDVRRIDWRVSNRTGTPHIRVHSEDRERRVVVILDQSSSMFFGSQVYMKSVVAAELAALFISDASNLGDTVGAIVFDDRQPHWYSPRRGRSAAQQLLSAIGAHNHALVELHANSRKDALSSALSMAAEKLSGDALVVLISDLNHWNSRSLKWMAEITRKNNLLPIRVIDDLEQQMPVHNGMVVSDGALQLQIPDSKSFLSDYANAHRVKTQEIESDMRTHALPLISFNCCDKPQEQYDIACRDFLAHTPAMLGGK